MGIQIATVRRPGISTSKVFQNSNFEIGEHLSAMIIALDRQEHFSLLLQIGRDKLLLLHQFWKRNSVKDLLVVPEGEP
jgi:hypothetical protein